MKLDKIRNIEDIKECVRQYLSLNDYDFLPADEDKAIKSLYLVWKRGCFIRVVRKPCGKIQGWIYAEVVVSQHMIEPMYQQRYFCTLEHGIKAYKVIKILHDALIEEASIKGIQYVSSNGSHFDTEYTFAKILEKQGWERRGYAAIYKI